MRIKVLLAVLVLVSTITAQQTKVLFLGNSYTGVNTLPIMFANLSSSLGEDVLFDSNTPGGYTLEGHSTNATSITKVNSLDWDFVVMQEQSQRPAFSPAQVAQDVYPYAEALVDIINANNICTEPMFYMTWGRKNGDQSNCLNYPPICTYAGMQQRLRESYLEMSQDNNAWCSPVGIAWKNTRDQFPNIELYAPDESHPSVAGTYLAACTFYASIFRKSPVGSEFYSTLDSLTAVTLQSVAASTVLDSLDIWNIGVNDPVANITYNDLGAGNFFFISGSTNAYTHFWDLGDGTTATGTDVQHIYTQNGVYNLVYVAIDSCGRTDTAFAILDIFVNAIAEEVLPGIDINVVQTGGQSALVIEAQRPGELLLEIFSINGALVDKRVLQVVGRTEIALPYKTGNYLYRLSANGKFTGGKFGIQ